MSECSLIGVAGVKLLLVCLPYACLWIARFSSRSALGCRIMGSGGRGASIGFVTSGRCCHPVPDTQRGHPAHRPHRNDTASALVRQKLELLASRGGLLAPAELAAVGPHAVQDHRQLPGHRDAGACHAAALCGRHAPGPQE